MPIETKSKGSVALAFAAALLAAPDLAQAKAADGAFDPTAPARGASAHELSVSPAALQHLAATAAHVGWWPIPWPWRELWLEIGPAWPESIPPPILT